MIVMSDSVGGVAEQEPDDLEWLQDSFLGNLWQVHGEFCMGGGPDHICNKDAERARAIIASLRAEVTAAKADALEQAANAAGTFGGQLAHTNVASVQRWLRARAADTRAELEGGQR